MMEVELGKMEKVSASGRNPLEIPEILENILECLTLKDLKASRLVSKLWRDCGIAPMKKKAENAVRLEHVDNKTINDLAEFSQCLNSVAGGYTNFPCSKVFLDASLIRQNKKERDQDEVLFAESLQKISPWVTELGLRIDLRKRITTNAFPLSIKFPKLKVLELTPYGLKTKLSEESAGNFYRFVTSILEEKAPSLRKVEIIDNRNSVGVDAIIKAGKFPFTEMSIHGPISNSCLEKLSKSDIKQMKLKSLHLNFYNSEVNNTSVLQTLRSQNESLETLVLYFSHISSPIMVTFPEMRRLKSLTILSYNNDEDDEDEDNDALIKFPVISYQRQFPALKTLHLNPWGCEAKSLCKQFIKQEMSPVETIEELSLPNSNFEDESLLSAQNAVRIFPNVKKLNMAADRAMLPTIFKHWTRLEQITLHYRGVPARLYGSVNRVLMGQTRAEYKRLQKRIKRDGENFDWNRLQPGNSQESIVNLQKLRVLRFKNAVDSRELEVGRAPIHLIVSRIRSLRCIDFGNRRYPMETKIDKAWWAELNENCAVLWNHVKIN